MINDGNSAIRSTTALENESTTAYRSRPLRVAIGGGGTGGHISPAVAVIEELRSRTAVQPIWIGTRDGYEATVAAELDIPFHAVKTGKLRRYASISTLIDTVRVPTGIVQARRILKRFQPDVIFSTGGFVSVPSVIAGRSLRIPSLTHEQTAYIGLATRINARFCTVVALSFERSRSHLAAGRAQVIVTGNPVRNSVIEGDANRGREVLGFSVNFPFVYVTGGALGARAINAAVREALPALLERAQLLHQCGPLSAHNDFDLLTASSRELPEGLRDRYVVRERVGDELGDVYAATDLVVGRSGAGTVNELAALGLPALLIPLPGAEEQRQNALVLVEAGSAELLSNDELTPATLLDRVTRLLEHPNRLAAMRGQGRLADTSQAARLLADELVRLARRQGTSPTPPESLPTETTPV